VNISIIIPTLNEQATIALAVDHAWAARPHEVIVVDGGSQDDTCRVAAARSAQVLRASRGRAVQQNRGARRATGDVLLFLHADTWLDPTGVRQMSKALADETVLGGAFRQHIESPGVRYRLLERGNALRASWRGLPYGDQGIFLRHWVFDALGGFPEEPLMEDLLLMRQLRQLARPVLLPGPVHVSPRRWQRYGVVRQTLRNAALLTARWLGASPAALARYYPPHGNHARSRR